MRQAHVIGAGLAGLSAALSLAGRGWGVSVYEAAPQAGGRCRSYFDRDLGCRIDNGNHLLLSGNRATFAYLDQIGTRASLGGPGEPCFPFMDMTTGARWILRPNEGRLPWWILSRARRVPGAKAWEFLSLLALRRAGANATVAGTLRSGTLYRRLLEPLAIAALNTPPEEASARLLQAIIEETLAAGGAACIPAFPRQGLSESLVEPALAQLRQTGAEVFHGRRVTDFSIGNGRLAAFGTSDRPVTLGAQDVVVLAVPPPVAAALLPELVVPDAFQAILNVHFRIQADPGPAGFIGVIGGTAEWVFVKPGVVSVTISAANRLADVAAGTLAARVWADVQKALGLSGPRPHAVPQAMPQAMPPWRVVKEKRATFAATPEQERRRPEARTPLANLALAGDWTATGLPATIEGAIRSGRTAADILMQS